MIAMMNMAVGNPSSMQYANMVLMGDGLSFGEFCRDLFKRF